MLSIRPYRGSDEAGILRVWDEALVQDPVSVDLFRRKVLLDPNFDAGRLLVAEQAGEVAGFVLLLRRKTLFDGVGLEPEHAWITAFGVRPSSQRRGMGTALFNAAAAAASGCRWIDIAPYVPGYFVPGVDEDAYPGALAFLAKQGYRVTTRAISMDAPLAVWTWPESERGCIADLAAEGICVKPLPPARLPEFLAFLATEMPPDWLRHARELLLGTADGRSDWSSVFIARQGDAILGYSQFRGTALVPLA